ncbi:MAG: hypothetical protein ACYTFI_00025 [Planctomycetota bacterium]|jgi:hypothetical protein
MGKRRLKCPGCGKAIAVSKTAKKARCPGCREVIDVAAALAGGADPSKEPAPAPAEGAAPEPQEAAAAAADAGATAESEDAGAEADVAVAEEKEPDAKPKSGSSRRSKSEEEPFPEEEFKAPARPPVTMVGPLKAWLAVLIGAAVVFAVLAVFFVEWYAAIALVPALALYIDSSLARITRVIPGSRGYGHAPMVWGLIGFVPVAGVVLYVLLRPKLVANSPEDIAAPGTSLVEMEDTGKIVAPSLVAPGLILVLPLAVLLGWFFHRQPSLELTSGTITRTRRFVPSDRSEPWFNQGKVGFRLRARSALEQYGKLGYVVVEVTPDGDTTTNTADAIDTGGGVNRRSWVITADKAGTYRMDVKDEEGDVIASARYRIRRQ